MFQNYFLLAWRHLVKSKGYGFINIAGLATGMTIALFIGLWIADEFSFDHYAPNHSRIAKALFSYTTKEGTITSDVIAMPLSHAFQDRYSGLFTNSALVCDGSDHLLSYKAKTVSAPAIWAEKGLPVMFGFQLLAGSTEAAADPSTALISESLSNRLFGKANPIGQTIKVDNQLPLRVGGVYADLPHNTTFHGVDLIMPWMNPANNYHNHNTNWDDDNGYLYVELAPNVNAAEATARIRLLPTPYFKSWHEEAMVYPLDKAHLYNDFTNGVPTGGTIRFVWLFGLIGAFVLLLACINFMNLSTARSSKRAKEIGIRKTIGSPKGQLIAQFLCESVLIAFIALAFTLLLASMVLPLFNELSAKDIQIPWATPLFWFSLVGFTTFTGLLAGSYPAFYLSGFNTISGFRNKGELPRKILVVTQFTVSLSLVIGTVVVFRQILFTKERPVGYSRNGLITVNINTPELAQHYEALRTELIQKGLASNVAATNMALTGFEDANELYWRGKRPDQESLMFHDVNVTSDYGATIGWTVLQGRDFSRDFPTDSNSMILNAAAAKTIGIKNPVGETMKVFGKNYKVIGVVGNMLTNSPYDTIKPAVFLGGLYTGMIIIRIRPGLSAHNALTEIEGVFKQYNPSSPFIYRFVNDDYAAKFASEQRIGNLATVFTVIAIFISCLGLFGLAAYVAEQRTKEIGVRKVLGASIVTLLRLLSGEFLKLTGISILLAIPLSYYFMNKWLESYAYHAPLSWWIFASAAAGIVVIALFTVTYQSLKAALMNPIKSLRSE
ncbi:MAG TPA: ABC transporter permease [Puia sp.]|nr:ABC transporter permease [Puia sp.]